MLAEVEDHLPEQLFSCPPRNPFKCQQTAALCLAQCLPRNPGVEGHDGKPSFQGALASPGDWIGQFSKWAGSPGAYPHVSGSWSAGSHFPLPRSTAQPRLTGPLAFYMYTLLTHTRISTHTIHTCGNSVHLTSDIGVTDVSTGGLLSV